MPEVGIINYAYIITFRVSRRRREMYSGHGHLCICLCVSVPRRMRTLLHEPRCNLEKWQGVPPSCALLGGFAIVAQVSLIKSNAKCQWVLVLALCLVQISFVRSSLPMAYDNLYFINKWYRQDKLLHKNYNITSEELN